MGAPSRPEFGHRGGWVRDRGDVVPDQPFPGPRDDAVFGVQGGGGHGAVGVGAVFDRGRVGAGEGAVFAVADADGVADDFYTFDTVVAVVGFDVVGLFEAGDGGQIAEEDAAEEGFGLLAELDGVVAM